MRVKKLFIHILILFAFIHHQCLCSSATNINNTFILKTIRKYLEQSNIREVFENLGIDTEGVLKRLEQIPDLRIAPITYYIANECNDYIGQSPYLYCKGPRSNEFKGRKTEYWASREDLKIEVGICEIDPLISFCQELSQYPLPNDIKNASDFIRRQWGREMKRDGSKIIFSTEATKSLSTDAKDKNDNRDVEKTKNMKGPKEIKDTKVQTHSTNYTGNRNECECGETLETKKLGVTSGITASNIGLDFEFHCKSVENNLPIIFIMCLITNLVVTCSLHTLKSHFKRYRRKRVEICKAEVNSQNGKNDIESQDDVYRL